MKKFTLFTRLLPILLLACALLALADRLGTTLNQRPSDIERTAGIG